MDYLPPGFPKHVVTDPVDLSKISWFCRRFTSDYYAEYQFGHFLLAAYASVPALLTPDLLYRMWMNFSNYRWGSNLQSIHRIAVSDVLLSPLCREVGFELYEMPDNIRFALRLWLDTANQDKDWQSRNIANPLQIAAFVEEYHLADNKSTRRWGKGYDDRQRIESVSVRNPAEAQNILLANLNAAQKADKKVEIFRVLDLMTRQRNLQAVLNPTIAAGQTLPGFTNEAFQHNALLADVWKAVLDEDTDLLEQLIGDYPVLRDYLFREKPTEGQFFEVTVPDSLSQKVGQIAPPTLYAFIAAAWDYQDGITKLQGPANDYKDVAAFIEQIVPQLPGNYQFEIKVLAGEDATIDKVQQAVDSLVQPQFVPQSNANFYNVSQNTIPEPPVLPPDLKDGDCLFFYFSGMDYGGADGRIFLLTDSRKTENTYTGLAQKYIEDTWFPLVEKHKIHVLTLYDTCYNVSEEQQKGLYRGLLRTQTAIKGSWIVLNAAEVGENANEMTLEGQQRGLFTHIFIQNALKAPQSDYNSLMAAVLPFVTGKVNKQHPFTEAFPPQTEYLQLLTGKTGERIYPVEYDASASAWILRAGKKQGITPSVGLIPTLIRLQNSQEMIVSTVEDDVSHLVFSTDLDMGQKYAAIVLQKAPEKIKTGKSGSEADALARQIDQMTAQKPVLYFEWTEQADLAEQFVGIRNEQSFLIQQLPASGNAPLDAFFPPNDNAELFSAHLEAVSRYYYLKKLITLPGNQWKSQIEVQLQKIKGATADLSPEQRDQLEGEVVEGRELTFDVSQEADPAFRCLLSFSRDHTAEKLYIYPFYFSVNNYQIAALPQKIYEKQGRTRGPVRIEATKITLEYPAQALSRSQYDDPFATSDKVTNVIPVTFNREAALQSERRETEDTLLIFLSPKEQPDLRYLAQSGLGDPATPLEGTREMSLRFRDIEVIQIPVQLTGFQQDTAGAVPPEAGYDNAYSAGAEQAAESAPPETEVKRNVFLLSVGINQYNQEMLEGKAPVLTGAVSDAQKINDWFSASSEVIVQTKMLLDAEATKVNVVNAFETHLGQAKKEDVAVFYFSGLGGVEQADPAVWREESDGQLENIVCYPTATKSGSFLLADKEMRHLLRQLSEKTGATIVTVFDSCAYPGSKTREEAPAQKAPSKAPSKAAQKKAPPTATGDSMKCVDTVFPRRAWNDFIFSRFFTRDDFQKRPLDEAMPPGQYMHFSACQSGEAAMESNKKGVFTEHLLAALSKTGGGVTYKALFEQIRLSMEAATTTQHPGLFVAGDEAMTEKELIPLANQIQR